MITVVTGPPCAGKSRHVLENAGPDDVRLDFDMLAQAIGSATPHAAKGAQREITHIMRRAGIARVLNGIDADSWIIHTWPSAEQLAAYKTAGATIVELDPGIAETLARAAADDRPEGTAEAIRAWYAQREGKAIMTTQTPTEHRTKAFAPVGFKAEGETAPDGTKLGPGEFLALAAVFDVIDSYGDRIIKGAFAETLAAWKESGDPIPVIWQHLWGDPNAHIGFVVDAYETDEGLLYKGKLDIEDNAFALQVYRLMKGRRVTQQSFGFDVIDGRSVTEEGRDVFEITRVHLYEVGPCLVGVNQSTNLLDIKSGSVAPGSPDAAEPSGRATPAAAAPSMASGSTPNAAASTGFSPASTKLLIEIENMEED